MNLTHLKNTLKYGASAMTLIVVLAPTASMAQSSDTMEVVTVTGFRGSLEKALDLKRNSAGSIDSIMAEDIAKFPDLNLSESLQRVPGVAISRDAGEGRQISVRGLGGGFTRTLVNGMELLSTGGGTDASGGTNRTRTFDFNVFASDLFNQLDVEKTSEAATEEGSLGSTVKLYTAHPLDINGFKLAASAKAAYNDLSHTYSPRFSALISDTFLGGKLGVLVSGAFVNRDLLDEGFSTVRWAGGASPVVNGFRTVSGVTDSTTETYTNGVNNILSYNSTATDTIFHPRIPRLDKYVDKQHRTGFTGSVQFQPDDATLFTLDALYANFGGTREEQFLESFTFQQTGVCNSSSPASCGINQVDIIGGTVITARPGVRELVAGTFNNVDAKSERRHDKLMTEVYQFTLAGSHDFNNSIRVKGFVGFNSSVFANSEQTTMQFDQYNVQNYKYDFTTPFPTISYGTADLTSSTAWQLVEIRINPNWVYNRDTQAQLNAEWDVVTGLKLKAGINWVEAKNRAVTYNRSNGTNGSRGAVLPTGLPALSTVGMIETFTLPKQPAANPTTFFAPDIMAGITALHLYDQTYQSAQTVVANTTWASPFATTCFTTAGCGVFNVGPESALGSNYTVQEDALGGYLQAEFDTDIAGIPVRGNFGTRVVQTMQSSLGYGVLTTKPTSTTTLNTIVPTTYHRAYTDILPSINLVIEPVEDLLLRASAAKVMSRPGLGQLNPGVTLNVGGNKTATAGNPNIKPFRAKTYDLAVEWYFGKGALLSVAGFYKDVGTFVQTYTSPQSVFAANPWSLPDSQADAACGTLAGCSATTANWTFSYPMNTPGGPVKGIEINYQQQFSFLPAPFDKFGALGNLTLVTSKMKYLNASGVLATVNQLTNLSQRSWNATLYYEDDALSARVSAAYRSKYLTQIPGRNGSDVEGTAPTLNIDGSVTYTIDENWAFTLEALNLTNQLQSQYFDTSEMLSFKHMTGREFLIGVRFNY